MKETGRTAEEKDEMNHKKGILYGVGVGPGDKELLTLKAVRVIRECGVIGIPAKDAASCTSYQIALQAVPEMKEKQVISLPVPMTTDSRKREESYRRGCGALTELLDQGQDIAFLNLGDPTVYGSYLKFHERVRAKGYQAEIISGVPSFCAAAAALEISLGQEKEEIHILPGFYGQEQIEKYPGTKVIMKSAGQFKEIRERLLRIEKEGKGKVCAVSNCGMEREEVWQSISEMKEEAGYFTTIILKENN